MYVDIKTSFLNFDMAAASTSSEIFLRPATALDIAQIHAINSYYVENTVTTFRLETPSQETLEAKLRSITDVQHLPYIVATNSSTVDVAQKVLGYAYVSRFRGEKGGYARTVELSIFCHPEYTRRGIGRFLLERLIEVLRNPRKWRDYYVGLTEPKEEAEEEEGDVKDRDKIRIKNIIACMSLDTTRPDGGERLRKWYESFGFVEMGRLKGVGWKFERE